MSNPKKILLVSSGQPSLNPRLVKEADALADAGYQVTVLYAYWNDWGTAFDKQLLPAKKWKAICIGGDPEEKRGLFFFSRLIHKIARTINQKTRGKYFTEPAVSRAAYFLSRETKKHDADLYIGHNLGALPAVVKAAAANKKRCGFDAEDFHRNEVSDSISDADVVLKTNIEDWYLPHLNYLTVSSPLIGDKYKELYPGLNSSVILNLFPKDRNVQLPVLNESRLVKLFWFSQTIGKGRGIEDVIKALVLLKDLTFEFHLLGQLSDETRNDLINEIQDTATVNLYFHPPVPPDEIPVFASQFDIGIASETSVPFNRDICLPNKIFTYMQAGLAIVASNTSAQSQFLTQYKGIGKVYQKDDTKSIADILSSYHADRQLLLETRKASLQIARQKLNWEVESKSFLATIEKVLNR